MSPSALFTAFTFVCGCVFGSFGNVLVLRMSDNRSVRGRSACPHCSATLRWNELIPILSYCLLMGRCRHCRAPIALRYPLMEVAMGSLFVLALLLAEYEPWRALSLMTMFFGLSLVTLFDIEFQVIPDVFTAIIFCGAVLWHIVEGPSVGSLLGALTAFLWFGIQWLPGKGKYVGSGDILLGTSLGLWLEWRGAVLMLFSAYIVGLIVCSFLLLTRRIVLHGTRIPFAPFLATGAIMSFLSVEWVWRYFVF